MAPQSPLLTERLRLSGPNLDPAGAVSWHWHSSEDDYKGWRAGREYYVREGLRSHAVSDVYSVQRNLLQPVKSVVARSIICLISVSPAQNCGIDRLQYKGNQPTPARLRREPTQDIGTLKQGQLTPGRPQQGTGSSRRMPGVGAAASITSETQPSALKISA